MTEVAIPQDAEPTSSATNEFDPSRYLTRVNGSDYLEVKWRLVWLRHVHSEASIRTELVHHGDRQAVFRAEVSIPNGGCATGWGSESPNDFRDFLEKAETKALGRALAALGFGTQFCGDFEFGATQGRVVDAPIDFASTKGRRHASSSEQDRTIIDTPAAQTATPRQMNYLQGIAKEAGFDQQRLNDLAVDRFGRTVSDLSRKEASALIETIQMTRQSDLAS